MEKRVELSQFVHDIHQQSYFDFIPVSSWVVQIPSEIF